MIIHAPHHILRACADAMTALNGSADAMPILHHVLALLLLKRHDKLPPPQQSLSSIARNLNVALANLERSCAEIEGITRIVDFQCRRNHEAIHPEQLRQALQCFYTLPPHDHYAYARAAEECIRRYAPHSSLPFFIDTLIARIFNAASGSSIVEIRPGSGERIMAILEESRSATSQFSNRCSLNIAIAEDDTAHRLLVQILCSLNEASLSFFSEADIHALAKEESSLRYDRILYVDTQPRISLAEIARLLPEHGLAVVCIPESVAMDYLSATEKEMLLQKDVIESIIRLATPQGYKQQEGSDEQIASEAWLMYLLRTKKPLHQRHRVLLVNDEAKTTRNGVRLLDEESIEEILSARDMFISAGNYATVMHRNKLLAQPSVLNPLFYCNKKDSLPSAMSLFGGIPRTEFSILTGALSAHGIDVSGYFIDGAAGYVDFAPALASRSLVRVAISSAPSLKNQETRLHYTFAHWWYRNELLIALLPATRVELEASFSEALDSVGLLDITAVKAIWRRWIHSLRHDYYILSRHGSHYLVETWLAEIENKASSEGSAIWLQLTRTEERLLEHVAPAVMRRIRTSNTTLSEIQQQQSSLHIGNVGQMMDEMFRRREQQLNSSLSTAELRLQVVEERITALRDFIKQRKQRIAELHTTAKAHPLSHDSKELFDSTLSLQDELAVIIGEIVPAQSELRLLEQSIKPYADLQERIEHEQSYIERMTQQLPSALSIARRSISPESATILVLDMFREHLTELLEERITENRERIIGKLERWWDEYKGDDQSNNQTSVRHTATRH